MDKEVVVITGSSGRIGARLIEKLSSHYQTIGMDFIGISSKEPSLEFIFVDLSSDESVECGFKRILHAYGKRIASIVHLAAYYSFSGKGLENYDRITVKGTERLLKQMKNFDVEQFIFTSTLLVHLPTKKGKIQTEDSPIAETWHYPASKVRTERLIKEMCTVPYVILRISGCYDEQCNCVPLSQHMLRIYEKQLSSVVFPGNSRHGVPFLHFEDLVDLIDLLINKRKEIPRDLTLMACEEEVVSYRELQTLFGKLIHGKEKWPMIWIPKIIAKGGAWAQGMIPFIPKPFIQPWMVDFADDNYHFSMQRARDVLGWSPQHKLREALPLMVQNLKKDPFSWYRRHQIPLSRYVKNQEKKHGR